MSDVSEMAAVIMAGGVGVRFWPLSTDEMPKQFLKLFGDSKSLLQKSYERIVGLVPSERILVLTNKAFVGLVAQQLPMVPAENIIGEPIRRDTAAAVCLGAVLCGKRFGNPVVAMLTADHMIEPVELFRETVLSAARRAREEGVLYTFGIHPTYPATGYGYLELGKKVAQDGGLDHYKVLRFKEKPDAETAKQYSESGRFRWNSGMFVWTVNAIVKEMEMQIPSHLKAISEAVTYDGTPHWDKALERAFRTLETISIDYAVMEKAREVFCIDCAFSWSDVGDWNAMKNFLPKDEDGNFSRCKLIASEAKRNLIFSEDSGEVVMLIGVKDLVVVRSGGKTLISHKDRTEEIKKLLRQHPV